VKSDAKIELPRAALTASQELAIECIATMMDS
jgi:hypothetical protein